MTYSITSLGSISFIKDNGTIMFLPPENNGTAEWREYADWLAEGNTPEPAPTPPPAPDYLSFWDTLITSTVYSAIREQSMVSLPMNTLATEFIALIGDAKMGRPNEIAIQSSMIAILTTGTFTEEHISELQNALIVGNLNTIYNLEI